LSSWQTDYLAPGRSPAELDFDADPDTDGLINGLEYKFGTHPFEPDADPVVPVISAGSVGLRYPDVEARTHVVLGGETAQHLASNLWTSAGITTTNSGQRGNAALKTASVMTDQAAGFVQLRGTFNE
jgi:hypothetical protein